MYFTCDRGQPISGDNFYHKRLDLYEKKAMRDNKGTFKPIPEFRLYDKFWCPDLMTYMIKVRQYTQLLKGGQGERKIHTVNCNIYIRRIVLRLGDN